MSATAASPCIVAKIDHVDVVADDADRLLALFAETFQFPVAWPMTTYRAAGGFTCGGVRLGNINLEIIRKSATFRGRDLPGREAYYLLAAFEPCGTVEETMAQLQARGVACQNRGRGDFWTNVWLPDLQRQGFFFLLCHYDPDWYAQYPALTQQLRERDGGPLGVERVDEVVISAQDVATLDRQLEPLLSPTAATRPDYWPVGEGPALRLIPGDEDGITGMVLRVRDLDRAARFLREQHLLGEQSATRVTIAPERLGSLQVHLVPGR